MADTSTPTCHWHHGVPASSRCTFCSRDVCNDCETYDDGVLRCPECAARSRHKRYVRYGVTGALVLGGLIAVIVLTSRTKPSIIDDAQRAKQEAAARAKALAAATGSSADAEAKKLRAVLARSPCSVDLAVKLGKVYNRGGRYRRTLRLSETHRKRCGRAPKLLAVAAYAHERLGEFDKAAAIDTDLIKGKPRDGDYWWWRGRNHRKLGRLQEAAADFRQAIANQKLRRSSGIAVLRFARVVEKLKIPCEGAFALRRFREAKGGRISRAANQLRLHLLVSGDCGELRGTGSATIKRARRARTTRIAVRAGRRTGRFLVDRRAAYTLMTRAFAKRIGLEVPKQPTVLTYALAALRDGRVIEVPQLRVGTASAPKVRVAVVDELPRGVDGVLGQSFFWRFGITSNPTEIALIPR